MKMNEIIRKRRLEKGYTQEQIANYLGVSAPAVNKWEKGTSYPDIVLLPPLARLLDTDLNTLLSFQKDLSEKEVALFMNEVGDEMEKNGFESGYSLAMEKLKEYPTCDLLVGNLAMLLSGSLMLYGNKNKQYQEEVETLFHRAAQSDNIQIKEQAQGYLISRWMEKQEYEKAQEMLHQIAKKNTIDTEQIQANIYIAQGDLEKAAKMTEEKLLRATGEIHTTLMTLMEIAIKENRMEDAEYIAEVDKQAAQIFDLWEYHSYVAYSQLYDATNNKVKFLKNLIPMLKSLTKKWEIHHSPLYRHIKTKEVDKEFGPKLQKMMIQSLTREEREDVVKENSEFHKFIKEIERE